MSQASSERRTIPNFAVMTHAEIFAFARSGHELAGVAEHIYNLEASVKRIIDSEFIVRDLATARNQDQVDAIQERAKAYVKRVFAGAGH